jgi:hypothetical protein
MMTRTTGLLVSLAVLLGGSMAPAMAATDLVSSSYLGGRDSDFGVDVEPTEPEACMS